MPKLGSGESADPIPAPGPDTVEIGGNTICVSVQYSDYLIVFDAGTGICGLGARLESLSATILGEGAILLTHYHLGYHEERSCILTEESSQLCRELLADIDNIFPPVSAASVKLTDAQCADVNRLRDEIRRLCEAGKDEEARRVLTWRWQSFMRVHRSPSEPTKNIFIDRPIAILELGHS